MRRELLLGAGTRRLKVASFPGYENWEDLTTLDIDPDAKPDVLWDLNKRQLPFFNDTFDEIHAYEVLEHVGQQGDWRGFFAEFSEYWRILKPGGHLFATCPAITSPWLWGDPGHSRTIQPETLTFLSQEQYRAQVGHTPMTDYRAIYKADFVSVFHKVTGGTFSFVLKAIK